MTASASLERDLRLNTMEVARFVSQGYLRFDALVPEPLNERFLKQAEQAKPVGGPAGTPLSEAYRGSVMAEILRLPRVAAVIHSLVGPGCLFDHQGTHFNPPASVFESKGIPVMAQHTHQDSTIDLRTAFDVQMFYYPHDVTPEMGGTRFIPGTHLRRVSESAIARYQNVVGQQKVVCKAGTLLFFHHGLWHGGEVNRSDRTRYMLKIRMNPTVRQVRLWNTSDLTPAMAQAQEIFDFGKPHDPNDLQQVLCQPQPWFEFDTGRLEYINRIKLWRHLLGDDSFDAHHWMTRIENEPV